MERIYNDSDQKQNKENDGNRVYKVRVFRGLFGDAESLVMLLSTE